MLYSCAKHAVLIGGIGETPLTVTIGHMLISNSTRGYLYNVFDLAKQLEIKLHGGRQGRLADFMTRLAFDLLD